MTLGLCLLAMAVQKGGQAKTPVKQKAPAAAQVPPNMFGLTAALVQPETGAAAVPKDVSDWSGWGWLNGPGQFPNIFAADGDWTSIWPSIEKEQPSESATDWPVRVFIFRRSEELKHEAGSFVQPDRATLEQDSLDAVKQSLLRASRLFEQESGGKLRVKFTVTEEQNPFRWSDTDGKTDRTQSLLNYITPRFNYGSFTANDQVFRGPFRSVISVWPVWGPDIHVSGPSQIDTFSTVSGLQNPGLMTCRLLQDLQGSYLNAARRQGWKVPDPGTSEGTIRDELNAVSADPKATASAWWASGDDYHKNDSTPPVMRPMSLVSLIQNGPISSNVTAKTVKMAGKSALELTFSGLRKRGGFALPLDSGGKTLDALKHGQYLTFEVNTKSFDCVHIGIADSSRHDVVSLGSGPEGGQAVQISGSGLWQTVSVSLKQAFADHPNANSVYIGFDSDDSQFEKYSYLPIQFDFADFRLTDAPATDAVPTAPALVPSEKARAQEVWKWTDPTADDFQTNFTKALADPSDLVRLNAYLALAKLDGKSVMGSMLGSFTSINPMIPEAAAPALAAQKTPEAWGLLVFQTLHGINSRSRAAAARALGESKVVSYGLQLTTLLAQPDWYVRWSAVKGLTELNQGTTDPDHLINKDIEAFLNDFDPSVRLAAIDGIDGSDAKALGQVLYSAVNDGSDAVRIAAVEKIWESGNGDLIKQSLTSLGDDSWFVRKSLLDYLAEHPLPSAGDAVEKDLTDENPYVRAAAIGALGACVPNAVQHLGGITADTHPAVQAALEAAAEKYKWTLPSGSESAKQ